MQLYTSKWYEIELEEDGNIHDIYTNKWTYITYTHHQNQLSEIITHAQFFQYEWSLRATQNHSESLTLAFKLTPKDLNLHILLSDSLQMT